MENMRIAVIGSGISGLSAAWLLSQRHQVTLYEADNRTGGHANTVDVDTPDGRVAVDTGFIIHNQANYPNLTALFKHLDVRTSATEMSFALSSNQGRYEYSGSGLQGIFGQPGNLFSGQHWSLFSDLIKFFRRASMQVARYPETVSLGDFLAGERYSRAFIDDHIVPMGAAIWSTDMAEMLKYPARSFIEFYANHGLLDLFRRPNWHTVVDGSRSYVDRLIKDGNFEILQNNAAARVVRHPDYVHITDSRGISRPFDHVVVATHADQALSLLDQPDSLETRLLGQFSYQKNVAVLHQDARFMPKRKRLWSSWNYLKKDNDLGAELCVTYWMNRLQNLNTRTNLFVTLNPYDEIHPKAVKASCDYEHPVFDAGALAAQKNLGALQGNNRTWFCGSYFGYGFHEDGAQSGLAVAEQLGGVRRPWEVADESGRITLPNITREAAE
jgi:predicted NAD/FAD-binding protein